MVVLKRENEIYAIFDGDVDEFKDNLFFVSPDQEKIKNFIYPKFLNNLMNKGSIKKLKYKSNDMFGFASHLVGYFPTEDIKSYFCSKCKEEYNDKPEQRINILPPSKADGSIVNIRNIGVFELKCNHCETLLMFGYIENDINMNKINKKNVVEDDRGIFIPITDKYVEKKLSKVLEEIQEGHYDSINLRLAKYWANKLSLDISQKVKEIEEIRERSYLKHYQESLPKTIENLEKHSEFVGKDDFLLSGDDELSYEEGTDFNEVWTEFVRYLPKLSFTPELKQKTLEIIARIKSNVGEREKYLKNTIEEKNRQFNKALVSSEKEVKELQSLEDLIKTN